MDSTTSPSDDSDSSAKKKPRAPMMNHMNNTSTLMIKSREQPLGPPTPLKEISQNQQPHLDRSLNWSKSKESKFVSGGYRSRNGPNGASSKSTKSRMPREQKRWA